MDMLRMDSIHSLRSKYNMTTIKQQVGQGIQQTTSTTFNRAVKKRNTSVMIPA